jgi:hypothetical protein
VISASLVACASRTPTARERALEQLRSTAQVVAAADGQTLATPIVRRVIDATRPRLPAELGCVIDAALSGDAVAVAFDSGVGATISIVTRVAVTNCPALSHVRGDRYVATIGGGTVVESSKSVLADKQWSWAHDYLLTNPIALAAELPAQRLLAVAQVDPLDGWLAIYAPDPTSIDKQLADMTTRWKSDSQASTKTLAGKVRTTRSGAQVLVRIEKPEPDDLIALINTLARDAAGKPEPKSVAIACPPSSDVVRSCQSGHLVVKSASAALAAMTSSELAPVVEGGDVEGLRLESNAQLLLVKGDIILGVNDRRVGTKEQLAQLVKGVGTNAALAIRRNGVDLTVTVAETPF